MDVVHAGADSVRILKLAKAHQQFHVGAVRLYCDDVGIHGGDRDRARPHALHRLVRQALRLGYPGDRHAVVALHVAVDHRWFHAA